MRKDALPKLFTRIAKKIKYIFLPLIIYSVIFTTSLLPVAMRFSYVFFIFKSLRTPMKRLQGAPIKNPPVKNAL